jgi:hypothetical protein
MTDSSSLLSSGSVVGKTSSGSGGNNDSGGSGQRVVREIGVGPANWPLLIKTNYTEWALIMKMLASLAVKATATEAWKAVRSLWISSEAVRNPRAQRLRTEFESIRFKEGETVDNFTMRLGSLVAELDTLGGGDQGAAGCPAATVGRPEAPLSGGRRD